MSQTVDADDDDKAEKRKSSAPSDQVEKENAAKIGLFAAEGKRQERGKPLHCCLSEGENELSSIR